MKIASNYCQNAVTVSDASARDKIFEVIAEYKPTKIIETGTHIAMGSTKMISDALTAAHITAAFYTIECNDQCFVQAQSNISRNAMRAKILHGLSLPRALLPDKNTIRHETVIENSDLFVDHDESNRAELYYAESQTIGQDDLLGKVLAEFEFKPDLVMLDSAGHLGWIEFDYVIAHVKGDCLIMLDDIFHVKHHRSYQFAQSDPRFSVLFESKEKFGFAILRFKAKV